jgi:lysophospholipase L1-like esterase
MKRPVITALALLLTAATWLTALPAVGDTSGPVRPKVVPVRIMPLGDSITYGSGDRNTDPTRTPAGYRRDLQNRLKAVGVYADFVGSMSSGGPDPHHEGHPGFEIAQLGVYVPLWITTYRPDIVLLMVGSNDISHGLAAGAPERLSALIDLIQLTKPDVTIRVATIPLRREPSALNDETRTYNSAVASMVSARWNAGQRVSLVPIHIVSPYAIDYYDSVHPNECGYKKISFVWYYYLGRTSLNTTGAPWPTGYYPMKKTTCP